MSLFGLEQSTISVDKETTIRGWVSQIRKAGAMFFIILRDRISTVQAIASKKELDIDVFNELKKVSAESVIELTGHFVNAKVYVQSCTVHNYEFSVKSFRVLSVAQELPLSIADAEESFKYDNEEDFNEDVDKGEMRNNVSRKVRLDNRWVDLRCYTNQLVMRCKGHLCREFRNIFDDNSFTEIFTPKLIGTASEGGANVFEIKYFDRLAFLAQSPQLYKQMCINSGLKKVFEIAPVFRADNANTKRHLCEFISIDMEMEIEPNENGEYGYEYLTSEIWKILTSALNKMGEHKDSKSLLKSLGSEAPVLPSTPCILTYSEGARLLNENGHAQDASEDLSTENEKALGDIVKEKYDSDLFILTEYPSSVRPFYTHPFPGDPTRTLSYDIILRGNEISSGARRINEHSMLIDNIEKQGINPETLKGYTDAFKHGSPPHGGCAFGMERLIMLYFNLSNVRRVATFPRDPKRLLP